jgi:hypothetical protein
LRRSREADGRGWHRVPCTCTGTVLVQTVYVRCSGSICTAGPLRMPISLPRCSFTKVLPAWSLLSVLPSLDATSRAATPLSAAAWFGQSPSAAPQEHTSHLDAVKGPPPPQLLQRTCSVLDTSTLQVSAASFSEVLYILMPPRQVRST